MHILYRLASAQLYTLCCTYVHDAIVSPYLLSYPRSGGETFGTLTPLLPPNRPPNIPAATTSLRTDLRGGAERNREYVVLG